MSDQYEPTDMHAGAPPTTQGDFVPVKPPESWPTVIGVLSIIFGVLGTLSNACGAIGIFAAGALSGLAPEGSAEEMEMQMAMSVPYPGLQGVQIVAEFGLSLLLLVGGIMLLMRKPAAPKTLVAFAWLDLLANTYGAVLSFFVIKSQMQTMQDNPDMAGAPAGLQGIMSAVGPVFAVIGWLLVAIWPVFLILWFRRYKIRESVASWA